MGDLDRPPIAKLPEKFGKYSILGHLATGGMAEVYLARQTGLEGFEKTVVIKRVRPELLTDREIIESFLDEARLVATLQHPSIAQVYEIGLVNQSYFIVMEYVHGGDLRQLMERAIAARQRVTIADAIYILIQACVALHYAHEKRGPDGTRLAIIHRDVTPSNVLLSYDGAVKVCDFGIAKAATRTTETERGTLKGKYAYMSPEQCQSLALDRRSDIFTLGILLYELSTLTRPFAAASDFELLRSIIERPAVPPSKRVRGYPPDLERIAMRALAKDPAERYPTAQAMQLELEELARERKLALSSVNIAKLVGSLFPDRRERRSEPSLPSAADPREAADRDAIPVLSLLEDSAAVTTALPVPPLDELPRSAARAPALAPARAPALAHGQVARRTEPQFGARTALRGPAQVIAPPPRPPDPRLPAASFEITVGGASALEPAPHDTIPTPMDEVPDAPRRPSAAWWIAALGAGLVAGGVTLAGRVIDSAAAATASAALDVDAERLAAPLDASLRSARLRANAIAATPVLHVAIETDAATMRDLAEKEFVFQPGKGETLEVFQLQRGEPVSLIRIPAGGPRLPLLIGVTSRIESRADNRADNRAETEGPEIIAIAGAPIAGTSGTAGEAVLATQIDLSAATRALAQHVTQASLRGPGIDLPLIRPAPGDVPHGAPRTFALPAASELGALSLVAVPIATAATWVEPAQLASLAAAALLFSLYLIAVLRSRRAG
ncbi:MAG TPA: serine/threonine-protein kinase [Kofleriaceae bacterium]|nr:serine/threonine-protein kinase [Kofleriaceae bacterium]